MHLWNSFSLLYDGRWTYVSRRSRSGALNPTHASSSDHANGIRELEKWSTHAEVGLAAVLGLIHGHKLSGSGDGEAVKELEVGFCGGVLVFQCSPKNRD